MKNIIIEKCKKSVIGSAENREVDTDNRDVIIERMTMPGKVWHFVEQRKDESDAAVRIVG